MTFQRFEDEVEALLSEVRAGDQEYIAALELEREALGWGRGNPPGWGEELRKRTAEVERRKAERDS